MKCGYCKEKIDTFKEKYLVSPINFESYHISCYMKAEFKDILNYESKKEDTDK